MDDLLTETRRALEAVRSDRPETPADSHEVPAAHGSAADGLVTATITGGRLDSFIIDPRLMRLPSWKLAEHVMTAVNEALDLLRQGQPATGQPADVDALAGGLHELQDRSIRQMAQMGQALQEVVTLLRGGRAEGRR
ncbi:YbaB/EbfC family nucleoid-associated protein [Micromonospora sp. WMMD1120]|uniref:YbaB/EbfC family nucleoid-associated protein n=1 Tax=Micromonospora sp. WMMD1120 TaxID=3016106 RepID=UPI002417DC52|nr:YbaB/EbfC family nucleoid-associated protein [Micromonospora sp. WMMD1120]MDG4810592.1 YbaB/EbfC family nucleoid-associated protein [Micromonospora sp. WMMD1120]